jgi:DNA-binding CsgD family transcriptional regulator
MRDAILLQILDDLALAVILVTPDLRVVETNAAAVELLACRDGLALDGLRLRPTFLQQQRELAGLIARVAQAPAPDRVCAHTMNVNRAFAPPLHLCVRALRDPAPDGAQLIALYAIDPMQQSSLDGEVLARAWGLTRSEVRVATELLQGHSVESTADLLCVSVHTVRTHLKNLFAKTGTCRQTDLVRLLGASLGGLRATRSVHTAADEDRGRDDELRRAGGRY